jgi:hypothetical protein
LRLYPRILARGNWLNRFVSKRRFLILADPAEDDCETRREVAELIEKGAVTSE